MIRHRLLCLGYFDFGSVGLFSLGFLSLFAVQTQHGQNTAADEQSSQPTDEVAAVTGLRRLGGVVLSWLIGVIITATCIAGAAVVGELIDDRILAALSAANGAFLVLDAGGLLGSGLVDHPLEACLLYTSAFLNSRERRRRSFLLNKKIGGGGMIRHRLLCLGYFDFGSTGNTGSGNNNTDKLGKDDSTKSPQTGDSSNQMCIRDSQRSSNWNMCR